MQLFILNDEVTQLELALGKLAGSARWQLLLPLAWHLRERDTRRALDLADEIENGLGFAELNQAGQAAILARVTLIRGEAAYYHGRLPVAQACAEQALALSRKAGDASVEFDSEFLQANVLLSQGRSQAYHERLQAFLLRLRQGGDASRILQCECLLAINDCFCDVKQALTHWGTTLVPGQCRDHPGLLAYVHYFWALAHSMESHSGESIACWIASFEAAFASGQLRYAVLALTNAGATFNSLNEHYAALEWMERGLELARPTGWEPSIALALSQVGETLRLQGQLSKAEEALQQARSLYEGLAHLRHSRNAILNLAYIAELALDQKQNAVALDYFKQLQHHADRLGHSDFQFQARCGQAQCLLEMEQASAALAMAQDAHYWVQDMHDVSREIEILKVLAKIHRRYALPKPAACVVASATLHYLLTAMTLAHSLPDYQIGSGLPELLATEYARLGDFENAWKITRQANLARDQNHRLDGTNRTIAMRIAHQTADARLASEHHRQMAATAAQRARALQQSGATLKHLSEIGMEITAQLDLQQVLQGLSHHIHRLMSVDSLLIFLLKEEQQQLELAFGLEYGLPFMMAPLTADDPSADSVRCWLERCMIVRDYDQMPEEWNQIEGTAPVLSGLFAPLILADRVLGVMSIQSIQAHAYDEQQQLIFRTLCVYGAIAIDNARTYRQVQDAQVQIVQQKKLAALAHLVTGVAQQLRGPLGFCVQQSQQLKALHWAFHQRWQAHAVQALERNELLEFLQSLQAMSAQINQGLHGCANLVRSFKQIAVDQRSVEIRRFNLRQICSEVINVMQPKIIHGLHQVELNISADIHLQGYPALLAQVLENLIRNVLVHAFEGNTGRCLQLTAHSTSTGNGIGHDAGRVQVLLQDNGRGIARQKLEQIFSPFLSTQLAQARYGLGLFVIT
jgi:signal transduction histidine kinase/tetratricopeptide (TPR) repeat protein